MIVWWVGVGFECFVLFGFFLLLLLFLFGVLFGFFLGGVGIFLGLVWFCWFVLVFFSGVTHGEVEAVV